MRNTQEQWGALVIAGVNVDPFGSVALEELNAVGPGYGLAVGTGSQGQKRGWGPGDRFTLALFDAGGTPFDAQIEGDLGAGELSAGPGWDQVELLTGAAAYRVTRDLYWPKLRVTIIETGGVSALTIWGWIRLHP